MVRRLSKAESELLLNINQGVPTALQYCYNELINKRQNRQLTLQEYEELLQLTDQVEVLDAQRVEYLIELAQMWHKPLPLLMAELGIRSPDYV